MNDNFSSVRASLMQRENWGGLVRTPCHSMDEDRLLGSFDLLSLLRRSSGAQDDSAGILVDRSMHDGMGHHKVVGTSRFASR